MIKGIQLGRSIELVYPGVLLRLEKHEFLQMFNSVHCRIGATWCTGTQLYMCIRTSRGAAICEDEERCLLSTASLEVATGRDIRGRSCIRAKEDIGGGERRYEN